jgi:hypothetical protein
MELFYTFFKPFMLFEWFYGSCGVESCLACLQSIRMKHDTLTQGFYLFIFNPFTVAYSLLTDFVSGTFFVHFPILCRCVEVEGLILISRLWSVRQPSKTDGRPTCPCHPQLLSIKLPSFIFSWSVWFCCLLQSTRLFISSRHPLQCMR